MTSPAGQICDELGTTLEEVEASAERVDRLVETADSVRSFPTSIEVGETHVHLHQLVIDTTTDDDWTVVGFPDGGSKIELAPPDFDGPWYSVLVELFDPTVYRPQYTPDGDPVWGY